MAINSKCKGCTRRTVGCHATCEDYILYKQKVQEVKDKRDSEMAKMYHPFKKTQVVYTVRKFFME